MFNLNHPEVWWVLFVLWWFCRSIVFSFEEASLKIFSNFEIRSMDKSPLEFVQDSRVYTIYLILIIICNDNEAFFDFINGTQRLNSYFSYFCQKNSIFSFFLYFPKNFWTFVNIFKMNFLNFQRIIIFLTFSFKRINFNIFFSIFFVSIQNLYIEYIRNCEMKMNFDSKFSPWTWPCPHRMRLESPYIYIQTETPLSFQWTKAQFVITSHTIMHA